MDGDRDALAEKIIKRYSTAADGRHNWESHWREIAERILPSYSESFEQNGEVNTTRGEKRTEEMYDATGALALPKFAAAVEFMTTPRGSTWHHLMPLDPMLKRNRQARLWFEEANAALFRYRYAPNANFASQNHESNISLGAFGTGPMFVDALDRRYGRGLRYKALHLSGVFFLENHQGMIDTCFRKYPLTARQAIQKFRGEAAEGEENMELPEDVRNAARKPETADKLFYFIHCVKPREEGGEEGYDPNRLDEKGMRYVSYHVSLTGKKLVGEGAYNVFPFPVSRYVVAPGETYGRSPAMMALPSLKTLNEQKKTMLKQGHRAVDPVLLSHDDDILDGFSLRPGAMNPGGVSADGRAMVQTLPVGNLALGKDMMDEEKMVIQDAFLLSLFQILIETPQMTATEVLERTREKGILLSPTMGRQQSEKLGPMIERELDVLSQQGLLPQMPPIVEQALAEYEVVYDSPMSRAQRAEEASGLMRTVDWAREYVAVSQDPAPLDWFDWDKIIPALADIQAVPASWMRDEEGVMGVRQARAQAAQQQQMIDAAPAAAGVMKALPEGALSGGQ